MTEKEQWLIDNIPECGVDILHADFVDKFIDRFKPAFHAVNWGAYKCPSLNRLLARMYKKSILRRSIIGLGLNWQPGFPKWVYVYSVRQDYR